LIADRDFYNRSSAEVAIERGKKFAAGVIAGA
jgi:hypothetical protein